MSSGSMPIRPNVTEVITPVNDGACVSRLYTIENAPVAGQATVYVDENGHVYERDLSGGAVGVVASTVSVGVTGDEPSEFQRLYLNEPAPLQEPAPGRAVIPSVHLLENLLSVEDVVNGQGGERGLIVVNVRRRMVCDGVYILEETSRDVGVMDHPDLRVRISPIRRGVQDNRRAPLVIRNSDLYYFYDPFLRDQNRMQRGMMIDGWMAEEHTILRFNIRWMEQQAAQEATNTTMRQMADPNFGHCQADEDSATMQENEREANMATTDTGLGFSRATDVSGGRVLETIASILSPSVVSGIFGGSGANYMDFIKDSSVPTISIGTADARPKYNRDTMTSMDKASVYKEIIVAALTEEKFCMAIHKNGMKDGKFKGDPILLSIASRWNSIKVMAEEVQKFCEELDGQNKKVVEDEES